MFQTNMWIYLWDLVDEGVDTVLDRLMGEAGVTGISVATSYHSLDQLRPHPGAEPVRFRTAGGLQFQPESARYANTRLKPAVASWLRTRNPLAQVAEGCARRGLNLRGWTVCCHHDQVAEKFESFAVKNVYGQIDPTWLCPANPDVREYLRAVVEDLTANYGFESFELERPCWQEKVHVHSHAKAGCELGEVGHWLYNLCFCESCRQSAKSAGIDAEQVARLCRVTLEKIFATGQAPPISADDFAAEHPVLETYTQWRCGEVNSLVESLQQAAAGRIIVHRGGGRFVAGVDFRALAAYCDATLSNCPAPYTAESIDATIQAAREDTGRVDHVELGFKAGSPECPGSDTLVRALSHAAGRGVRSVNLYNYGILPLNRMEWIKRAVRYAGRELDP